MFNGHSSSRNLSMGGYSSDGSTPLMRDKSQFPLETDQLSLDGSPLVDDSRWTDIFKSDYDWTNVNSWLESLNHQINEAETSEASFQTDPGCAKFKCTPTQKVKKRKADVNYRQKLGDKMRVLQGLVPGCSKVKGKEAMLDAIINYVQSFQRLVEVEEEKTAERIAENIHLKAENDRLNAENTMLKEQIGLQPSSGKHLEHQSVSLRVATDHHGFISEAVDKDHHGTNSEAVDKLSSLEMNELQTMWEMVPVNATSLISGGVFLPNVNLLQLETVSASKISSSTSVGLVQEPQDISEVNGGKSVSGLEAPGDACLQDEEISLKKRKRSVQDAEVDQAKGGQPLNMATQGSVENQDKGVWNLTTTTNKSAGRQGSQASDSPEEENMHIRSQICQTTIGHGLVEKVTVTETINYVQSLAASRPISNGDEAISDILLKLEADDESKVKLSDFDGLDGERITIGKYSFPISLHPIVKKIMDVYGDVSATSKMNPTIAEAIYIMFCASVKEMSDQRLEQVTEGMILKWRDVIRDALSINFKVDFAMEHLNKIAHAYIGLTEQSKILKLEAQLSATKERSKVFMDAAEDFRGKPVSSGMFQDAQTTRVRLKKRDSATSFSSY